MDKSFFYAWASLWGLSAVFGSESHGSFAFEEDPAAQLPLPVRRSWSASDVGKVIDGAGLVPQKESAASRPWDGKPADLSSSSAAAAASSSSSSACRGDPLQALDMTKYYERPVSRTRTGSFGVNFPD